MIPEYREATPPYILSFLNFFRLTMSHRPSAPDDIDRELLDRVQRGQSPEALAEAFDASEQSIRNWLAHADRSDGFPADGPNLDFPDEGRRGGDESGK